MIGHPFGTAPSPELAETLALPGRKLVLCDNGNKPTEFKMCAPRLQPGDVIGVHDWIRQLDMSLIEDALDGFVPFMWEECEYGDPREDHAISWRFWKREGQADHEPGATCQ